MQVQRSGTGFFLTKNAVPDFCNIFFKKSKLPQWYTDQQHRKWPEQSDDENVKNGPPKILLYTKHIHDFFSCKTGHTSAQGKSAKDQDQPAAVHLPFFLKPFQHK